uniref:Putative ovule protein n=1 Tax=Solanum chacoense TaxID=4108 RepID=A0A0V0GX99_SOLCH
MVVHNTSIKSYLEIHLYWSGNGSANYGPLISAISVTKGMFSLSGVLSVIFFSVLSKTTIL